MSAPAHLHERVRLCTYCHGTGMLPKTRREVTAEMMQLRAEGLTYQEIAARYGISRQSVYLRFRVAKRQRQDEVSA